MTLPSPSVNVIVLPGSAEPVMVLPSVGSIVGVAGAAVSTLSMKLGLAGETLPAASVAVAVKSTLPSGRASGVNVQSPLSSAVTVPI
ncbi:hypothetical protein BTW08_18180 [Salinicola sp. MH3R3-1]|nr:hypothetical protein BTW08_18180 [Salinicola sp. MH3R3-1]